MPICQVPACSSPARSNGLCRAHYERQRRYGDPLGASPRWVHRLSGIDEKARTAVCANCGPVKITRQRRSNGNGWGWRCQKKRVRSPNAKNAHGNRAPVRRSALASQGGRCAICQVELPEGGGHHDHDHETGLRRGVLCLRCNIGLGHFRDDPVRLAGAIEYLRRWSNRG